MKLPNPQAILFDLDGTLADTAPDLAAAVNLLRTARALDPIPYDRLRPVASAGARGLIGVAFGISPDDHRYLELRDEFLRNYVEAIADRTVLFEGVKQLLDTLAQRTIVWGIVTNKAARLTDQLVPRIGLGHARCVISGDTTPFAKPHPEPLLEASRRLGIDPLRCWYIGDDSRDIEAGRAAGMQTIAAGWGYCGHTTPVMWGADALAESPLQIIDLISSD